MADVTDGFDGFLYNIDRAIQKLVGKQRKDIQTTLKVDLQGSDAILRGVDCKLSRPGPSS